MTTSYLTGTLGVLGMAVAAWQPVWAFDSCIAADVNGDGVVDKVDVDLVISLRDSPPPQIPGGREDVDGDGFVSQADVEIVSAFLDVTCPCCPADLDFDLRVDLEDRLKVEAAYGRDCRADLNRDGKVNGSDSSLLDAYFGSPAPLSRAAERADLDGNQEVDDNDRRVLESAFERDCRPDLDKNGTVDARDVRPLLDAWGSCPDPPFGIGPIPKPTCDEGGRQPNS